MLNPALMQWLEHNAQALDAGDGDPQQVLTQLAQAGVLRVGISPALGGSGGMIAVDRHGNIALPFNSEGMYRGFGYVGDAPSVGIYR